MQQRSSTRGTLGARGLRAASSAAASVSAFQRCTEVLYSSMTCRSLSFASHTTVQAYACALVQRNVCKQLKEGIMLIYDRKREEFIEFSLREFAKRANRDIVLLDVENDRVLEYDPEYTNVQKLKKFLPDVEDVEVIHVAIFAERFGRKVVDRTLKIKRLHEVLDLLTEGRTAALISDSGYVLTRLSPEKLGEIIEEFFIEKL